MELSAAVQRIIPNVLVADKENARKKYKAAVVDDATIDDILLLYVKGERAK